MKGDAQGKVHAFRVVKKNEQVLSYSNSKFSTVMLNTQCLLLQP